MGSGMSEGGISAGAGTQASAASNRTGSGLRRAAKAGVVTLWVTTALAVGLAVAGAVFGRWAVWAGLLVAVTGFAAVARPFRHAGLGSRWRGMAAALAGAYLALFGVAGEATRDRHPGVTFSGEQTADGELGPNGGRQGTERQTPVDRVAEQRRLAEERQKTRDSERQAAEVARRRAELAELEGRTAALNPADLKGSARHFERLAALAPDNADYIRRRDDFARRVREETERAEWLRQARLRPEHHVTIERFSWRVDGFGTVFVGTFTIKNPLPFAVKDLRLRCDLKAPSGTQIDSVGETVFERLESNQTRTFRGVNLGFMRNQANSANCTVVGAIAL